MASTQTDILLPSSLNMAGCAGPSSNNLPVPPKNQFSVGKFFKLMKFERLRLITYLLYNHQWPKMDVISPSELAKAGFFYLRDDAVQCTFCRGIVKHWSPGDVAIEEHKRHYPKCPFVIGEYCGNMPIEIDPKFNSEESTDFNSLYTNQDVLNHQPNISNYNRDDIPKYPLFSEQSNRVRTFLSPNWKNSEVDSNQLIDAGFFYTGKDDRTRCFHCGGMLFKWKSNENPLEEHARFFPECYFIVSTRGQNYVEFVQFKSQIIELRKKFDSSQVVINKDIESMRKMTYENFLNMKQSVSRLMSKLDQGSNKSQSNSTYQRYANKDFFLMDCQELYQYVQHLEIMKSSSPITTKPKTLPFSSSVFCLDYNENSESEPTTPKSSSDEETDDNGNRKQPDLKCIICCDRQIQIVFVPCGHQMACLKCSEKLNECPVCRVHIDNKIRTYFAH